MMHSSNWLQDIIGTSMSDKQQILTGSFVTCENVQEQLIYQRDILCRKWLDIQSDGFQPIPIGTLYKIKQTGQVPKKWWKILGIKSVRQPRIAVNKVDMKRAANSIINNISTINIIQLVYLLNNYLFDKRKSHE